MEKAAETLFKKYKQKYITKLGRHALNNIEIDKLMKSASYKGCYAQDELFPLKPGMYVINTDLQRNPGLHWISLYLCKKTAYFYDSFGRDPKKLVPILIKRLRGYKIVSSDRSDKEQKNVEIICGHLSCGGLSVAKDLGIRAAIKI
jgi:hypothetical protein